MQIEKDSQTMKGIKYISVADSGCLSWIRIFFIPDPNFSIKDPESSSNNLCILIQKIVFKLSEIWSRFFILDPDPDFLPIPDPGVKKAPDPISGFATLKYIQGR